MKAPMKLLLAVIGLLLTTNIDAQKFKVSDIKVKFAESPHAGRIHLTAIENRYDTTVVVRFINEFDGHHTDIKLKKKEKANPDLTFNVVLARPVTSSRYMEIYRHSRVQNTKEQVDSQQYDVDKKADESGEKNKAEIKQKENPIETITTEKGKVDKREDTQKKEGESKKKDDVQNEKGNTNKEKHDTPNRQDDDARKNDDTDNRHDFKVGVMLIPTETVVKNFVNISPFVSEANSSCNSAIIAQHLEHLQLLSIDKEAYVKERKLMEYIESQDDTISQMRKNSSAIIDKFLLRYEAEKLDSIEACRAQMGDILKERACARDSLLSPLKAIVKNERESHVGINWKLIGVCLAFVLVGIILFVWYRKVKNKQQTPQNSRRYSSSMNGVSEQSLIVVGQKTTPTMKKQSLDDVYDNETYVKIDSKDFCTDSAVRTLYIKNSCVKDIYNMYAEDLRYPGNPGEDGCMVLGRWVYDEEAQQYDVSLEYIVLPGEDAVFSEYELNFGGKIKLTMSEKLRKLRQETDLQYDLTCWVHSHPGLGVFFSNSDNNVHMQLKKSSHPKFLTALVIDIMTPQQETGIFTFKQDETVNSKNELTKMYSLEELYQWALVSERKSFDAKDYFNALGKARNHVNECYSIQLSNGAIIDMTFLAAKTIGFIGFVHGFNMERGEKTQCIIATVTKNETMPDNEMLGCFVVAAHCSIPSLRKTVAKYLRNIRFVLVYTATDGLLTSIPVVNQNLCNSENYYGEQKLDDLKIWTRRRR